jgi:hypothetical protein
MKKVLTVELGLNECLISMLLLVLSLYEFVLK